MSLRKNTGYEDNKWSLVAGHCEGGESASRALCREALEEIGVSCDPVLLKIVHVMHRRTDRDNIDIFIESSAWDGVVSNCEPEKCGGLEWYSLDQLPFNTIEYIRYALNNIKRGVFYSEEGYDMKERG